MGSTWYAPATCVGPVWERSASSTVGPTGDEPNTRRRLPGRIHRSSPRPLDRIAIAGWFYGAFSGSSGSLGDAARLLVLLPQAAEASKRFFLARKRFVLASKRIL